MWLGNRRARPTAYYQKKWAGHTSRKSVASTTMIVTGTVTLVFVVLHLKTFKYGAHYQVTDTEMRDLYRLVMEVFSKPGVCGLLRHLHGAHRVSSPPRHLERIPVARRRAPALHAMAARGRQDARHRHRRRVRDHSGLRSS